MSLALLLLGAGCHASSTREPTAAARSSSLRQSSDDIAVSGRAAGPSAVYTTAAAIIYDAGRQALTIDSARPAQLDGLAVTAVRIAPFGTGFAAGAGLAGSPEDQPTTRPVELQAIGAGRNLLPPLGRVVIGGDPPVPVARWLVVAYRLAGHRLRGSLHDLVLRYTTHDGVAGVVTIHFSVQLCLASGCTTTSTAATSTTIADGATASATGPGRP